MGKCLKDHAGGLFGCFSDIPLCLYGTFCFYCLNSQNGAKVTGASLAICHFFAPIHPFFVRKGTGKGSGFMSDCEDCLVTDFCFPCAICQDARSLGSKPCQFK